MSSTNDEDLSDNKASVWKSEVRSESTLHDVPELPIEGQDISQEIKECCPCDWSSTVSGPWPSNFTASETGESTHCFDDAFRHMTSVKEDDVLENTVQPSMCIVCGKEFPSQAELDVHTLSHVTENPQISPEKDPSAATRERSSTQTRCTICKILFKKKRHYDVHIDKFHTCKKKYKCPVCGKGFLNCNNLLKHKRCNRKTRQNCSVCAKSLCSPFALARHMEIHNGKTPYVCSICEEAFTTQTELDEHTYQQKDEKPFKCLVCKEVLSSAAHLKRHSYVHTGQMRYNCSGCGKGFWTKKEIDQHWCRPTPPDTDSAQHVPSPPATTASAALHDPDYSDSASETPYPCNVCHERFYTKYKRTKHNCPFSDQTPHICLRCGVRFSTKSDLKEHIQRHTNIGSYPCLCCGEIFGHLKELNCHIRDVHMCLKSFICSLCGRGYVKNLHLQKHLNRHKIVMGHKCFFCNKEFLAATELQNHSEFHTSESCHTCVQCGEFFSSKSLLEAHNYTRKVLYKCAVCCEELPSLDAATGHMCSESTCPLCGKRFPRLKMKSHRNLCFKLFFQQTDESPGTQVQTDSPAEIKPDISYIQELMNNSEIKGFEKSPYRNGLSDAVENPEQTSPPVEGDFFACSICGKMFAEEHALKRHHFSHTCEPFQCVECGEEFIHGYLFSKHSKLYRCAICCKEITCKSKMLKHKAEIQKYTCHLCKKPFCSEKALENHKYALLCKVCGRLFCSLSKLKNHERSHTQQMSHFCFLCGKGYILLGSLKEHAKYHQKSGQFACMLCQKLYMNKQELNKHHCTSGKSHNCFLCGLELGQYELKTHMHKLHTCRRKVNCPLCGQGFTTELQLKVHTKQHASSHSSKCLSCDKQFCLPEELEKHMDVHAGRAPHACPVCGEGFSSWSDLQNHNYTETDKMPHQCTECGQRFWLSGDLTKHSYTHKRCIENSCSLCHVKFMRWFVPNLKRSPTVDIICNQCRQFAKKKLFEVVKPGSPDCELCVKGFTKQWDLSTHLLSSEHRV